MCSSDLCEPVIARLHPGLTIGPAEVPALAEHITQFSLAGMRAIAVKPKRPVQPRTRRKRA